MGTGLLEARVFGVRAAQAVAHDLARSGTRGQSGWVGPAAAARPDELERVLDRLLAPLAVERPAAGVVRALAELEGWPEEGDSAGSAAADLATLRRAAAVALLREASRVHNGEGVEPG